MEQKTPRLYPPAPLGNIDIEHRLEKKLDYIKCFYKSMNKIKEKSTWFNDKNQKSARKTKDIKS